jgi:glycosyltransferase involved in cell wall biosynthesis
MAEIINGKFERNETNQHSMGGTEILTETLAAKLDNELLKDFQIISSRVKSELDPEKIRIFWAHDLPGDPESKFMANKNEMNKFHKYVFVSNWQMQAYINAYNLPWSKCTVIHNAIEPFPAKEKPSPDDGIRIIYHSTPHRGLNILVSVIDHLSKKHKNIHLDVFSSFQLYGWAQRDKEYENIFKVIEEHPNMTNHGTQPNSVIREYLEKSHIFAYPSIWPETSCLCLLEAMSAGNICIHSNFAALYETAGHWTHMYQMNEDQNAHASTIHGILDQTIENIDIMMPRTQSAKAYVDLFHSWPVKTNEWTALLKSLQIQIVDRSMPEEVFSYSTS